MVGRPFERRFAEAGSTERPTRFARGSRDAFGMSGHSWLAWATATVLSVGALAACNDVGDALTDAGVRVAVDKLGTVKLQHDGITIDGGITCRTPEDHIPDKVSVECTGRTDDDRKITIKGRVSHENGDCVRGDLSATVGTRQVFKVDLLGDCDTS